MSLNSDDETPYNEKNILISQEDVNKILERFGINLKCINIDLYRKSLVNKSYVTRKNENIISGNEKCPNNCLPLQEESNERFEFLGDSVLSTTVANYLYKRYPEQNEGFLTKMRSKLVNGYMLSELCTHIGLNKWVIISKQIEESGGRENYKILEDIFEAFICAIFMDFNTLKNSELDTNAIGLGFQICEKWIINVIEDYVDFAELIKQNNNYKDKLIKYYQHTYLKTPKFFESNIDVINGKKIFTIVIKDDNEQILGIGKSDSKKKAEQVASENVLNELLS
jgi:ribonuclease-3